MERWVNKILMGDALMLLREMADESVDMIFAKERLKRELSQLNMFRSPA